MPDRTALAERFAALSPAEQRIVLDRLRHARWQQSRDTWQPYPWQVPPGEVATQGMWLMLGGRGTGKTDGAARYVDDHVNGPPCDARLRGGHRLSIIAPTLGDAVESCVNGPSGLRAHNPEVVAASATGGTFVRWPSGAEAKLFGASTPADVERLRAGGNRCLVWLEEVAAMRYLTDVIRHSRFGLRLGARPHYVGSTTPKPRPEIKALLADPRVLVTRGRTDQAWHLDATVRAEFLAEYGGTRLGRQELDGEVLDDVEGALWTGSMLAAQARDATGPLVRVVTAVDPAVTATGDEWGIVTVGATGAICPVCGPVTQPHAIVLADSSGQQSPERGLRVAVTAATEHHADALVAEVNNGGDMIASLLRTLPGSEAVAYRPVRASRGKQTRAEPVVALYEQGRVHHVPGLVALEDQMLGWVPGDGDSPDRVDALVWALTSLLLGERQRTGLRYRGAA